jgi:hypothetical protein
MKTPIKYLVLIVSIIVAFTGLSARAQTTNTAPSFGGAVSTFTSWVGNINTNYSFASLILWDGPLYANNVNIANELGGSYDLWLQNSAPNNMNGTIFDSVEGRFRQAGIAGVYASGNIGDEIGWMKGDFRAFFFADGVYLAKPSVFDTNDRFAGEFGIQAEKMFSPSTAGAIFVSMQTGQSSPFFGVNFTVTFGSIGGLLNKIF